MCRIIFYFFRFYYAEMRRKLWPKAPAKEGTLGRTSKNFQVYFIHINFFKKPNKKIYNRAKELYRDATIFFLIHYCLLNQKKMETEKWSKAADSPLLTKNNFLYFTSAVPFRCGQCIEIATITLTSTKLQLFRCKCVSFPPQLRRKSTTTSEDILVPHDQDRSIRSKCVQRSCR